MLFNSITFLVFLPIVFALYWWAAKRRLDIQNGIILIASYVFYAWWDWRFLGLIFTSSLVDYTVGIHMGKAVSERKRKWLLSISLTVNLGLLITFKYADFFIESFRAFILSIGISADITTLNIILPVGISFYTFQTLSYTIDVYRGKVTPTKNPIAFFAFISFFPQLVAGPIERAASLLTQFRSKRQFDVSSAKDGLRQMLWGFFKKMVVADNLAPQVEYIFNHSSTSDGVTLLLGAFFLPSKYIVTSQDTRILPLVRQNCSAFR
jgi:D-alanyl-lipoteichoic acid acyltransferase DltB (MBOAT superfamily)